MLFESVQALREKVDAYFAECDLKKDPYTITGLAVYLETSRQSLINYEDRPEFFDTIKGAKDKVEAYAEKRLFSGNATGPIFALKNFGWSDKQELEHSGAVSMQIVSAIESNPPNSKG